MDTKRFVLMFVVVIALVAAILGQQLLVAHLIHQHPGWAATEPTLNPSGNSIPDNNPSTNPSTMPGGGSAPAGPTYSAVGAPVAMPATIGIIDPAKNPYPMQLSVDPMGAGLKSVTLGEYYKTAAHLPGDHYVFEEPTAGLEDDTRALATRTITIDGHDVDVSGINWAITSTSADSATYKATITESGHPILELTKTFKLLPTNAPDGSQGYDVSLHQSFRELSGKSLKISAAFNGPTPPGRENDRSEDRRYVTGHDGGAGDKWVETSNTGDSTPISDLKVDKPPTDLSTADPHPLFWVGACSSYFQAIYRPDYAGVTNTPAVKIASAMASALKPGTALPSGASPTSLVINTSDFTIQPGHEVSFDGHVFFGPKLRQLLENPYYSRFPLSYDKNLVYTGGWCGFLTFNWLINVLYGILWFFHSIFRDWGLAIIGLVCLVRLLLHPITKRSQISMMEMSKKQPEIERLKKKFADNKEELNKAMMEVMNPAKQMLGCLPMFLQTPIWIALWNALQSTFELRQSGFLRWQHLHLTWIADLSHPDALIAFAKPIPLPFGWQLASINILPLVVGAVSFVQQVYMIPAPPNMTPEQEQQRKMQRWMLLLFPIMLYLGPSGLNLYILTSSTIGMIESKIIRDHIKQKEEAEKAGLIIIDPPAKGGKNKRKDDFKKAPPKKQGRLAAKLAELLAQAEQVRRDAERRKG